MDNLALCTRNEGKRSEFKRILGFELDFVDVELAEIQSLSTSEVCARKAADAFALLGRPVVVDDSGLHLSALGGFPGALIAEVLKAGGVELVIRLLPSPLQHEATAITSIGFADARGVHVFEGRLEGAILARPRGDGGFGYDSIFAPNGLGRSLAEMTPQEKDNTSPRRIALESFRRFLAERIEV